MATTTTTPPRISIITSAVNGCMPHALFLKALRSYAKRINATIIVTPLPGNDRDSVLHESISKDPANYVVTGTYLQLGRYIDILQFRLKPEQINPLTGLERFIQNRRSAIIPSTKQFFKPVCSIAGAPRVVWTTGSCTEASYKAVRTGEIAEWDHVIGAVIVECGSDGFFHARHIRWKESRRAFIDLGIEVKVVRAGKVGKVNFRNVRAEAIIPGDWHSGDTSEVAKASVLEMIRLYEPKKVVLHDIFNGHSINHHEMAKANSRARAFSVGRNILEEELKLCGTEILDVKAAMPKDGIIYIAKSNHDEWLDRWIEDKGYTDRDDANYVIGHHLALAKYAGKDVLEFGIKRFTKLHGRVKFLQRGGPRHKGLVVGGYQVGQHGDKGANGSTGSLRGVEKAAGRAIVGHRHSPEVFRGVISVGTTTKLDLPYASGNPSTWLHAAAVVWPDGSAQLLVQLGERGGKWCY